MKFINKSILVVFALLLFSCKSDYQKMESKALESGEIHNDLFLGLELGMDKKSFYEVCWDLNKEGILSNGPTELSVEYNVEMPSGNSAKMRFYPKFKEEKIYLMPVEFNYESWALWNEELSVEKLRIDVVALFEKWYGAGFIEVASEDRSQIAYIKMDGNRRIRLFNKSISSVRAEIVDLPIQKSLDPNEL
ncbi:hypothetical protein [Algoriphagus ratkowskyi]|nr:hypothetical protein [Algoriphagus ratkowskyi]TXD78102.1 hypothetical protein ESW18_08640 [Algoriphagus ratkowskyi]